MVFNSLLQMVLFAPYALFFCNVLGVRQSTELQALKLSYGAVSKSVGIVRHLSNIFCAHSDGPIDQYLGIPLAAGALTRLSALRLLSAKARTRFFNVIGPLGMLGLLYVIIVLFANQVCPISRSVRAPFAHVAVQGRAIIQNIGTVFRICVPWVPSPCFPAPCRSLSLFETGLADVAQSYTA